MNSILNSPIFIVWFDIDIFLQDIRTSSKKICSLIISGGSTRKVSNCNSTKYRGYVFWNFSKWADYWCTNVNDEFIILCYRHQQGEILSGYSECIKTTNGVDFDRPNSGRKTYKLNKDYNRYARMTTFNGQAVLIGIAQPQKYVEVFDKNEGQWLLKNPSHQFDDLNWSVQYALVPLKDKLLHLGGNDFGDSNLLYYNYLGSYLDAEFSKWTRLEQRTNVNGKPGPG